MVAELLALARLIPRATIGRFYRGFVPGDAADWRKGGKLGFAYYDSRSMTALVTPHWLPTLVLAALAVAPWSWRSWRFSLRTLLIATTLVAFLLGLIIWLTRTD